MFMLMLFMFCFFLGSIAMFWYVLRKMDAQTRAFGDEHAQLRVLLRAMESRLDKIGQMERLNAMFQGQMDPNTPLPGEAAQESEPAAHDPLLHLSFDQPQAIKGPIDPGLDLNIETAPTWNIAGKNPQANDNS